MSYFKKRMEPFDIGIDFEQKPSVNFGSGIELLMNDKKRSASANVHYDLGDLDDLENELNGIEKKSDTKTLSGFADGFFGNFGTSLPQQQSSFVVPESDSALGQATVESASATKTWDGFSKINEVPATASYSISDREKKRKKRMMLKKLEQWHKSEDSNSSSFRLSLDSSYEDIEDEYNDALDEKRKKDAIKFQQSWFITGINTLEYANSALNPFDIDLTGWGDSINDDIDSFDEIFGELYEKYKGGKLAPEITLLLRLGFSASVTAFTNRALNSAPAAFQDIVKQSPELMRTFANATSDLMKEKHPSMGNMMNQPDKINTSFGPPPPPMETKNQLPVARPQMQFTGEPANRPDIQASRGAMFYEKGVDVNSQFSNLSGNFQQPSQEVRREMTGPKTTDIDSILSGLKTKVPVVTPQMQAPDNNDSMISISSLKNLENNHLPKKTNRRKNKSEKNMNSIVLDI